MSAVVERTDVGWSEGLTGLYTAAEAPPAAACNSMLLEVVALADRLVAGTALMDAGYTAYATPTRAVPGQDLPSPECGRYLNAADLTGTDERTTYALAMAQVAREIRAGTGRQSPLRAGIIQLSPGVALGVVVACVLVGVAVTWYALDGSLASRVDRLRHSGMAEAGRQATERVRVAAATGQPIAPPGPMEIAAADDIREAARQARDAGIGQHIDEAVSAIGKATIFGALVWGAVEFFKTSRKD